MKIIYRESLHPVSEEKEVEVDCVAGDGQRFNRIAVITNVDSVYPFIQVYYPMGMALIAKVIEEYQRMSSYTVDKQ